jgi:hypothetical protein
MTARSDLFVFFWIASPSRLYGRARNDGKPGTDTVPHFQNRSETGIEHPCPMVIISTAGT